MVDQLDENVSSANNVMKIQKKKKKKLKIGCVCLMLVRMHVRRGQAIFVLRK
jgi:hypothetical protein